MTNVRRKRRKGGSKSTHKAGGSKGAQRGSEADPVCCDTCLHIDEGSDECHRLPPAPFPTEREDEVAGEWPPVGSDDWCGAWVHYETYEGLVPYLKRHKGDVAFGAGAEDEDEERALEDGEEDE